MGHHQLGLGGRELEEAEGDRRFVRPLLLWRQQGRSTSASHGKRLPPGDGFYLTRPRQTNRQVDSGVSVA